LEVTDRQKLLASLPSVDEVLKSSDGTAWISKFGRKIVLQAVRDVMDRVRKDILSGKVDALAGDALAAEILEKIADISSFSLVPVINATGVVVHTNLGRAVLSEKILKNVLRTGAGYSNLEYDLEAGSRGQRHAHTKRLLKEITGAEDAIIVNNNAAAVLLCLRSLAKGKEVVVSRGELVEIGGSFRVPDVMAESGAILREVGTTNKTHLRDYEYALTDDTALLLKIHQSNYKIIGFTAEVGIGDLVSLGRKRSIPVMFDLGSGCLMDLKPYGIHGEPTVQEVVKAGVDIVSFSGDKLLGGPQGGIIAGKSKYIDMIRKNPLARALRVDKFTIAAFEATLMEYLDPERAKEEIPVLRMLFQPEGGIRSRASRIAAGIRKTVSAATIDVVPDSSRAGGGSLPEAEFPTYTVSIMPRGLSVNELESRLRRGSPPVIARIKEDRLILDARTISGTEVPAVIKAVCSAMSGE
jgi:L-seryl-tRNA(Ser) seleniumtransferase